MIELTNICRYFSAKLAFKVLCLESRISLLEVKLYASNFIKEKLQQAYFFVNSEKFFRTAFFKEHRQKQLFADILLNRSF